MFDGEENGGETIALVHILLGFPGPTVGPEPRVEGIRVIRLLVIEGDVALHIKASVANYPAVLVNDLSNLLWKAGGHRKLDDFGQRVSIYVKSLGNLVGFEPVCAILLEPVSTAEAEIVLDAGNSGSILFVEAVSEIIACRGWRFLESRRAAGKAFELEREQAVAFAVSPLPAHHGRLCQCL